MIEPLHEESVNHGNQKQELSAHTPTGRNRPAVVSSLQNLPVNLAPRPQMVYKPMIQQHFKQELNL